MPCLDQKKFAPGDIKFAGWLFLGKPIFPSAIRIGGRRLVRTMLSRKLNTNKSSPPTSRRSKETEAVLANRPLWIRGIATESPQLSTTRWSTPGKTSDSLCRKSIREKAERADGLRRDRALVLCDCKSIRDAFYYLMNIESHEGFLAQGARDGERCMLKEAWRNQELMMADAEQVWKFFPFTQDAFDARMQMIYDNYVRDNQDPDVFAADLQRFPLAKIIDNVLQFAFQSTDGAWLRHITPDGPLAKINDLLFRIRMDELGDGNVEQNHANVYTDLLRIVNIYLPDLHTRAYADNPALLNSSFTTTVFLLAISEFNDEFFPELLGMTLELEWGSVSLPRQVNQLIAYGITPQYYKLHVGIDNVSPRAMGRLPRKPCGNVSANGAPARRRGSDAGSLEAHLERLRCLRTLGSLGADLAELPTPQDQGPSDLWNQMAAMIASKAQYASLMYGDIMLGENRLNDWFEDPFGLLEALQEAGIVVPGNLDSPIFRLMGFNGPMYKVFNDEQQRLWQRWVLSLPSTHANGPTPQGI